MAAFKTKISKAYRPQLRKLNPSDVEVTLKRLNGYIGQSRWLQKSNRYAERTTERLPPNKNAPLKEPRHLAQYIAASSILHCADGWSYLGRAIDSLLKGDPHRVVHLAYYAELRAALSLLAAQGVGIFRTKHYCIDGADSAIGLGGGPTHAFTWDCFNYWAGLKQSGKMFASVITPGGLPLSEWFTSIGGIEKFVRPQAKELFWQWSMDLRQVDDDHNARNESSYRPDGIPSAWYVNGADALGFATELWQMCEPSQNSLFENIDRHILRFSIHNTYFGIHGIKPSEDNAKFATFVASIVDPMGFDESVSAVWKTFLEADVNNDIPSLFAYSTENASNRTIGHVAVLARAALLLRLSAGSALQLVRSAGITGDQLEFWWSKLGLNRGIWDGSKSRDELFDLWNDLTPLVEEAKQFQAETPANDQTFHLIGSKLPHVIAGLGGYERVAIWSMTP